MRLLVLGGTVFAGREIVTQALERGWQVTSFNRGLSGDDVGGVRRLRGDRADAVDVSELAGRGPWDAVVDTSGYVPRNALEVARALESSTAQYLFVSTVSVYAGWPRKRLSEESAVLEAPADAGPDFGENMENGPSRYGYQKAGCERAVEQVFGADRTTLLRPGVVLGPREYVGRLPWWLRRVAEGGRVVTPGPSDRSIQPVDVRDLAAFALVCAEQCLSGAFNVTAPVGRETFGGMLAACVDVTGVRPEFVWLSDRREAPRARRTAVVGAAAVANVQRRLAGRLHTSTRSGIGL